tara:strand:- start:716 stop:1501 length:786 start_codon:yes stop_codon:yes gene_type:complete
MSYPKKSLGQNFLVDQNIIKKIVNLSNVKDKNILEIGPGRGALTDEIIKRSPKTLTIIEKDFFLAKKLKEKYGNNKKIKILNHDILKFKIEKILVKKSTIFGNLPYNISSQILIKIIKLKNSFSRIDNIIFMFQKELGNKIVCKFPSPHYGRLSILTNFKLNIVKKFLVSPNCFYPKPKVTSMVIHFRFKDKKISLIKEINNLEKITSIFFSNKRKMVNKTIKKLFNYDISSEIPELNTNQRPSELHPDLFYKITELFERK